jgi:hypothetical protein
MRMSLCDVESGVGNVDARRVSFGPRDVSWVTKPRYSRALRELMDVGFVVEVESGSHGKRGVYDLTGMEWV